MKPFLIALYFYLLVDALDIITSIIGTSPRYGFGLHESNPFCRYASGEFNLVHGLAVKALFLAGYLLAAYVIYLCSNRVAKSMLHYRTDLVPGLLASIPLLYSGYDTLMNAVVSNVMLMTGFKTALTPTIDFVLKASQ